MRRSICLLTALLISLVGQSQNLVQNPGFESYISCPNAVSQFDRVASWVNASSSSPDYYNKCGTAVASVPHNSSGYQVAHGGNAYAGIFLWSKGSSGFGREYISGRLSSALLQGHTYHFEMFVNLANICRYTGSTIGAYFSDTLISSSTTFGVLPYTPQVMYTGTTRFDTTNWTSVSGDFVARGGERFLVIGNFKADSLTDTLLVNMGPGTNTIFYSLIDDVSLVLNNPPGTTVHGASPARYMAGPNPFSEKLHIRMPASGAYELILTDMQSRVLVHRQFSTELEINTSQLPPGMYFYQIRSRQGVVGRDRILKL